MWANSKQSQMTVFAAHEGTSRFVQFRLLFLVTGYDPSHRWYDVVNITWELLDHRFYVNVYFVQHICEMLIKG